MDSRKPGHRPVTMRDVAKAAGVSRMTVSRALKKDSPISSETRKRILKVVKDMNYVPDQVAGSLTTKRSGFVGLLLPSLNNLHFAQTAQSLTDVLEQGRLQLLLGYTAYSPEREEQLVETMLRRRPEAMVLSYDGHTEQTIQLLQRASIPIVEIWEKPAHPIGHTVGFSNKRAAYDMTQALLARGFRKIVFLGEKDDDWTRGAARRAGFKRAMREAGLNPDQEIRLGAPPLSIENGVAAADQILQEYPDTDCIFCVSDMPAFGLLSRLKSIGVAVPEQVSVVGFGNFEVSRFASPEISTVRVDPIAIGRETGSLILRLLDQKQRSPLTAQHITLPPVLEFRASLKNL